MKVIAATGFVPVIMHATVLPYKSGEIVGVPPERAREWVEKGVASLAEVSEGIATFEVEGPKPADAVENGASVANAPGAGEIEIAADWTKLAPIARIGLAKKIKGMSKTDSLKAVDADEIIKAELARRGGNAEGASEAADSKTDGQASDGQGAGTGAEGADK